MVTGFSDFRQVSPAKRGHAAVRDLRGELPFLSLGVGVGLAPYAPPPPDTNVNSKGNAKRKPGCQENRAR